MSMNVELLIAVGVSIIVTTLFMHAIFNRPDKRTPENDMYYWQRDENGKIMTTLEATVDDEHLKRRREFWASMYLLSVQQGGTDPCYHADQAVAAFDKRWTEDGEEEVNEEE